MKKGHSEEYFSEDRDFWWNRDYLELMARRLRLNECGTLLDIGCGQCHWSQLLAPYLRKPVVLHALDSDPKWAAGSDGVRRAFDRLGVTVAFKQGDVQVLPYPDSSFDLVTCQTLLIHLQDPQAAVREMFRVVKPGGLVLCVEPNNLAGALVKASISAADPIEDRLRDVRCHMLRERGKAQCGEGDNSFGDLLPGVFAGLGVDDIRVYLSDKAAAVYPPYQAPGQQASLTAWLDMEAQGAGLFDRAEMQRYLAALGQESRVEEVLQHFRTESARMAAAIKAGDYATGGGVIMYLVSGRKPAPAAAGQIAAHAERRTEGGCLVRNRANAAHYGWGDGCDGWRLHEDEAFGVIEELVPPGRAEVPHRHTHAGQAFVILEGEADLILEDGRHTLRGGDSLHVPAGVLHQFRNDSPKPVRFLVISAPRRDWDRIAGELPGRPAPAAGGGSLKRMPTLETARVVLRPFSAADAAEVMRLAGDRAVADTTLHIPHPYQAGMAEEWIATHQAAFDREQGVTLAITRKPDGALVGAISLMGMAKGHQAELGYWIGKPFWSQGYCTEAAQALLRYAFTDLGLVRVHAGHLARNPASGRVMQKIGMHKEGCLRQHVKKWDKLEDLEIYAILKKEWEEAAN
jgi:RimJ/RimL family protein N-acetyltransferase/mannose-6-phosphate isomerase-like protein (cupin superfamily)